MIKLSYVLKNNRNIVVLKGEKLFRNVHFQKICSSLFNLLSSGTVISFQKVVYCTVNLQNFKICLSCRSTILWLKMFCLLLLCFASIFSIQKERKWISKSSKIWIKFFTISLDFFLDALLFMFMKSIYLSFCLNMC